MDESKGFHFYRRELFLYFGVYFAYLIYGFWTLFGLREELQQHSGHTRDPYNYELDIFNNYCKQDGHGLRFCISSFTADHTTLEDGCIRFGNADNFLFSRIYW
ncbi:uncharacterized protein LOC118755025 [Rhagoletis pomonella]|uniref:uncharacterized protein LOC118755025 n=1 Tax=Rhagoletis pomonella TaxID=28610 RepID=UPI0017857B32|nr:uncharacterized protein LOC118755025 [Rhagoletis pomonella]